ncbi:D-alanyl-D-alanine carboxypeptidase [Gottschalkia purinilytica]|uniref:D-alanyl-D-alanine carboxypeptidase n=1 Tax=Gottschalkia purinilytica TaxID=1503 RepID=A0A0L0WA92_GOTPU|nr:M15 family metallopeptidase [Gottschalkia purinilytica]KNF08401.1 D-alanyl-D-alanine carboxypeptidase [Gottschalkia purinilytica]
MKKYKVMSKKKIFRRRRKMMIRRIIAVSVFIILGIVISNTFIKKDDSKASSSNNNLSKSSSSNKKKVSKDNKKSDGNNINKKKQEKDKPLRKKEDMTNPESIVALVNKQHSLPSNYIPKDLVVPNVSFSFSGNVPKKQLRKEAAFALEQLFEAAKDDNIELFAVSGYRSYKKQTDIFRNNARRSGEKEANRVSAHPGESEHQTGLTMDVSSKSAGFGLIESFGTTKEGKWLKENCWKYGFIIRYPKEKEQITGYKYEPWHIRYVGTEVAKYITSKNITLEEYWKSYE